MVFPQVQSSHRECARLDAGEREKGLCVSLHSSPVSCLCSNLIVATQQWQQHFRRLPCPVSQMRNATNFLTF